MRTVYCDIHK
nr:unnamed protein product [Callosobruchus analis]